MATMPAILTLLAVAASGFDLWAWWSTTAGTPRSLPLSVPMLVAFVGWYLWRRRDGMDAAAGPALDPMDRVVAKMAAAQPQGMLALLDTSGRVAYASESLASVLGMTSDHLLGRPIHDAVGVGEHDRFAKALATALDGHPSALKLPVLGTDQSLRTLRVILMPRRDDPSAIDSIELQAIRRPA